ncbi:UDP-galactose transporter senju [Onthophagus taurus]|uniref:UDP-galactose transporter senju n=1 Tax=Onthophagus taurus TaxID=166361 RepID=UPI000C20AC5D|nr:UDP-galactose transporter senju [Onthophagus taurus]
MGKISWSELFPTNVSFVIFASYILLFSIQGVIVTSSQSGNKYNYDVTTVVLLTEFVKLIASSILYCKDNNIRSLFLEVCEHWKLLALYLIPAFLYSLYNNLAFHNLTQFDPTTYNILLQFRVVITAILFQIIFRKKLSKKQWLSLLLLTLGCIIKQISFGADYLNDSGLKTATNSSSIFTTFAISSLLFIFIQILCSCFAGVYNEHLLKSAGADVNIFIQNVFMYLDSILCNAGILLVQGKFLAAISSHNLEQTLNLGVILVVANNATVGIITSFFLKTLNSILKVFASSLELVLVAIFTFVFLNVPIYLNTVISIITILIAVYLYSQNPVSNAPVNKRVTKHDDEDKLLEV